MVYYVKCVAAKWCVRICWRSLVAIINISALLALLSACGKAQQEDQPWLNNNGNHMRLPTAKQLNLDFNILPQSLVDVSYRAMDQVKADELTKSTSAAGIHRKKIRAAQLTIGTDDYDPFKAMLSDNKTDSDCGIGYEVQPPLLPSSFLSPNSFCLVAVSKLALHRAVSHYSNFSILLPQIVDQLAESVTAKGVEHEYVNQHVDTFGSDGLRIRLFYDDCTNHQTADIDQDAYNFCLNHSVNSVYHKVKIHPLAPKRTELLTTDVIAKMEWIIHSDSSTDADVKISRDLMSEVQEGYTPRQMQFSIESSPDAGLKNITIKFERNLIIGSNLYTNIWNANVIKVSRIPASGDNPTLWAVQGNIHFELDVSTNPIINVSAGYNDESLHFTTAPRIFFSAVAEDVFMGGKAIYNTMMGDAPGLDLSAYLQSQWSQQFHMWAAYKKLLQYNHSEEHYLYEHRLNLTSSIHVFNKHEGGVQRWLALTGHADSVNAMDISNDGTLLVSASEDGSLRLWDINQSSASYGQVQRVIANAHEGAGVQSVKFHPADSDVVASGGSNGVVYIRRVSTGDVLAFLTPGLDDPVAHRLHMDWSSDGSLIATASDTGAQVWNAAAGELITSLTDGSSTPVYAALFFPGSNEQVLTSQGSGNVYRWNISSPSAPQANYDHSAYAAVLDIALAPDAATFSSVTLGGPIFQWNIADNSAPVKTTLLNSGMITRSASQVKYSMDGTTLFLRTGSYMALHDLLTDKTTFYFIGDGGADDNTGLVSFALTHDGKYILVGHNGASNQPLLGADIEAYSVEDGTITPRFIGHNGDINSIEYSPDGSLLLTAGDDHSIRLWNPTTGDLVRTFVGHSDRVHSATFNNDGSLILSASEDGTAKVWDTATGLEQLSIIHDIVNQLAVNSAEHSADNTLIITGGDDRYARAWDATTGELSGWEKSIRNASYEWVASPSNPNEYYLRRSSTDLYMVEGCSIGAFCFPGGEYLYNGDPFFSVPTRVTINGEISNTQGVLGGLTTNQWAFGDNDGLGFSTVYINLAGNVDPDGLPEDAISVKHNIEMQQDATVPTEVLFVEFAADDPDKILLEARAGFAQLRSASNMGSERCEFGFDPVKFSPDGKRVYSNGGSFGMDVYEVDNNNYSTFCVTPSSFEPSFPGTFSGDFEISDDNNELIMFFASDVINRYDNNPLSETYTQLLDPGQYRDTRGVGTSLYRNITAVNFSPNGNNIVGTERLTPFDLSWVDFDGYFARTDESAHVLLPDENDQLNPFYVEAVDFFAGDACYWFEVDPVDSNNSICGVTCNDVEGCLSYKVTSQFDHDRLQTTPDSSYDYLKQQLDALTPAWITDKFIEAVIE